MDHKRALADILARADQQARQDAIGWVVLALDAEDDPPKPVMTFGVFDSPEQALIEAGRLDADELGGLSNDWQHQVLPVYKAGE